MIFKGLDTSNNLRRLVDENYASSESEVEESKLATKDVVTTPIGFVEESKAAVLT